MGKKKNCPSHNAGCTTHNCRQFREILFPCCSMLFIVHLVISVKLLQHVIDSYVQWLSCSVTPRFSEGGKTTRDKCITLQLWIVNIEWIFIVILSPISWIWWRKERKAGNSNGRIYYLHDYRQNNRNYMSTCILATHKGIWREPRLLLLWFDFFRPTCALYEALTGITTQNKQKEKGSIRRCSAGWKLRGRINASQVLCCSPMWRIAPSLRWLHPDKSKACPVFITKSDKITS